VARQPLGTARSAEQVSDSVVVLFAQDINHLLEPIGVTSGLYSEPCGIVGIQGLGRPAHGCIEIAQFPERIRICRILADQRHVGYLGRLKFTVPERAPCLLQVILARQRGRRRSVGPVDRAKTLCGPFAGSGTCLTSDGWILTNAHVVALGPGAEVVSRQAMGHNYPPVVVVNPGPGYGASGYGPPVASHSLPVPGGPRRFKVVGDEETVLDSVGHIFPRFTEHWGD